MMRSGPIQPEEVKERIDRREEVLPLWEQGNGVKIDLPWSDLNRSDSLNDVQPLVAECSQHCPCYRCNSNLAQID